MLHFPNTAPEPADPWQDGRPTIADRIRKILREESSEDALVRVQGYLEQYYWSDWVLNVVADLCYQTGKEDLAGRYWWGSADLLPEQMRCVEVYEQSLGNSLLAIARDQCYQPSNSPQQLSDFRKARLRLLLEQMIRKEGLVPGFARNWVSHLGLSDP